MSTQPKLFTPVQIGDLHLKNRVIMAPLTRNRADHGPDTASELSITYYRQRAGAGLIISEGTQVSHQGQGYAWTPGLYTEAQVAAWRKVTDGVHAAGGLIAAQIWHVGRISHASLQPNGGAPVAPSAINAGTKTFIPTGFSDTSDPRALDVSELAGVAGDYAKAAANALKAGFDGVEIHGANGYLVDQFLKDGSNTRTDAYGGSVENRARFPLEVVDAILKVFPKGRLGIRLSPVSPANNAVTSDPAEVFGYFAAELSKRGLAFIHVVEGATGGPRDNVAFDYGALRSAFSGAYIANNSYTRDLAIDAVETGRADAIAFGRPYIANPDLAERLRLNAPLNALKGRETLYGGGAEGYTDYPALGAAQAAE
jgi:N-ethylmaleimide reductase